MIKGITIVRGNFRELRNLNWGSSGHIYDCSRKREENHDQARSRTGIARDHDLGYARSAIWGVQSSREGHSFSVRSGGTWNICDQGEQEHLIIYRRPPRARDRRCARRSVSQSRVVHWSFWSVKGCSLLPAVRLSKRLEFRRISLKKTFYWYKKWRNSS